MVKPPSAEAASRSQLLLIWGREGCTEFAHTAVQAGKANEGTKSHCSKVVARVLTRCCSCSWPPRPAASTTCNRSLNCQSM